MKATTIFTSLVAALLLLNPTVAQEAAVETPKAEVEAAREQQRRLEAEQRAKALLEKKPVTYGGFLVDASRAEKKSRFFSLRQPRDPKNDTRNISFHERTGQPRGFVLFRVEF
jgi:hypothetical protein